MLVRNGGGASGNASFSCARVGAAAHPSGGSGAGSEPVEGVTAPLTALWLKASGKPLLVASFDGEGLVAEKSSPE